MKNTTIRIIFLSIHEFSSFEIFNISNDSPFQKEDLTLLYENPEKVILKYFPQAAKSYHSKGWSFPESIDRVYSILKAKEMLGYDPKNNFAQFL